MTHLLWAAAVLLLAAIALIVKTILGRSLHLWLGSYLVRNRRRTVTSGPVHLHFCIGDHYEPYWNKADRETARRRVREWIRDYERIASAHRDADGRIPKHTYFYPIEEYDPEILDSLSDHCRRGFGDVEVHLHHDDDTAENLRSVLSRFVETLHRRHGLLRKDEAGRVVYGFIHGNWALDNSRPDGKWCGVNNELTVLRETGCYADFTLPSAPDVTQTRTINTIYFAQDDPDRPKSHDTGREAEAGYWDEKSLLMIQGPLALNWRSRKLGLLPRIENGELSADNPATPDRIRLWLDAAVRVKGAPDHIFIKLYSHGAQEPNAAALLQGGNLDLIWTHLERHYNDGKRFILHYVTAYEMYCRVRKIAT
jgi:hypothetical protein